MIEADLAIFDWDGTIVNTDELLVRSLNKALKLLQIQATLTFEEYSIFAHSFHSNGLWNELQIKIPQLQNSEIRHRAKHLRSKFYSKLIDSDAVQFKPGVESTIKSMIKKSVAIYVVTSSSMEEINIISKRFPLLKNIDAWFTRECYSKRKPDPECYIKAISHFEQDQRIDNPIVIGFEDTPKGLTAIQDSKRVRTAVLVTPVEYPDRDELLKRTSGETIWCKSFNDVPMAWA